MSNWTPGPWRLAEIFVEGKYGSCDRWVCEITCPKGNLIIADIPEYRTYPEETPMIEANARLIAAAPELLEALRDLDEAYCDVHPDMTRERRDFGRKALAAARAAIAKATGAES